MYLFDMPEEPTPVKLSYGRRLTIRQHQALADNRHPLMGGPLNTDGSTCGTCVHHVTRAIGKVYHKCLLRETSGPATDIRVSWPGCLKWKPQ